MFTENDNFTWSNWSQSIGPLRVDRLFQPYNSIHIQPPSDEWQDGLSSLVDILKREDSREVQARGEGWSYSNAGVSSSCIVDMTMLNGTLPDFDAGLLADATLAGRTLHIQAGSAVANVIRQLLARGLTLKSVGGNCGQSIYGAIATGTHGAFYRERALADSVRGLHLIQDGGRQIWLERSSTPLTRVPEGPGQLALLPAATVMRDDAIFDAALVSIGCFGIVHSLVLEGRPQYWFAQTRVKLEGRSPGGEDRVDANIDAVVSMDPVRLGFPDPALGKHIYLECIVNPYSGSVWVTHGVEAASKPPPLPGLGPGFAPEDPRAGLAALGIVIAPGIAADEIEKVIASQYTLGGPYGGTLLDCIPRGAPDIQRRIRSIELCVASADLQKVMTALIGYMRNELTQNGRVFPGAFSVRRCRATAATFGFTRFDSSCTIELPALNVVDVDQWHTDFVDLLAGRQAGFLSGGVQFTQHLGQGLRLDPAFFRQSWTQANVQRWLDARSKLLTAKGKQMFQNQLGRDLELF